MSGGRASLTEVMRPFTTDSDYGGALEALDA
jgi:hypothetical protein